MRELIANLICIVTLGVAIALSWVFALRHNPAASPAAPAVAASTEAESAAKAPTPEPDSKTAPSPQSPVSTPETVQPDAAVTARGREVFQAQRCTTCHSVAGEGNPRYPLDDVGSRLSREDLPDWITGSGAAAGNLSAGVVRRKQQYKSLSAAELADLVNWLSTLK